MELNADRPGSDPIDFKLAVDFSPEDMTLVFSDPATKELWWTISSPVWDTLKVSEQLDAAKQVALLVEAGTFPDSLNLTASSPVNK